MEITVRGCEDCPMYSTYYDMLSAKMCNYPKRRITCAGHVDLFATCPLKNDSLTIKLATDEQTTS
jgi:hypothetical protein